MTDKNNKGILVVSFGTLHEETRIRTIDAIEEDLSRAFPERKAYRAWTSTFIIKKLREKTGISIDTVAEALQRMKDEGITDLLVQPTHLLNGFENRKLTDLLTGSVNDFENISIGRPILDSQKDIEQIADVIITEIYPGCVTDDKTALLLMGHGSDNEPEANTVYSALQERFIEMGLSEIVVATIEGRPSLEDALSIIKSQQLSKIAITPLMIVAGNHAVKDMAGDQDDSWKNILISKGFQVETVIRGLGEYPGIRNMLIIHGVEAAVPADK